MVRDMGFSVGIRCAEENQHTGSGAALLVPVPLN
jgi:hypothetical protein